MRWSVRIVWIAVLLSCLFGSDGIAQLRLNVAQPNIDSVPVVRVGVGITLNGVAVTGLQASNFAATTDGTPITSLELVDCDVAKTSAIAIVVDTSASMKQSVGTGTPPNYSYTAFRDCFSRLVERVPTGSLFALVPFGDSATYSYPTSAPWFYQAGVDADTTALMAQLRSLKFDSAGTYVDAGLIYAAQLLRKASVDRRVIVLVTDDYVDEEPAITALLQTNSISLYVMQLRPDSGIVIAPNRAIAEATSGGYFEARDSTAYGPIMRTIADQIFRTQCTLRYVDSTLCPWQRSHDVRLTLRYNAQSADARVQYSLGANYLDSTAPHLAIDSARSFVLSVVADKNVPCECALRDAAVSSNSNCRPGLKTVRPDSLWFPLNVIDTLYPADADVTVIDVNGNRSTIHVHYSPKPDTLAPVFDPVGFGAGAFQAFAREVRGWDRGLRALSLDATSQNVVLDLEKYYRKDSATIIVHIHDLALPATACLIAEDSVGNIARMCLTYAPGSPDLLPPQLVQDVLAEPRKSVSGDVTEQRLNDAGIRDIQVIPGSNTTNPQATRVTSRLYHVAGSLVDSMYSAVLYVHATDSAGNEMRDSLVYQPMPDVSLPQIQYSWVARTISVGATEIRPWDRGLKSVTLLGSPVNATLNTSAYQDARHWAATLSIIDTEQAASFTLVAIDSAGNAMNFPLTIPGRSRQAIDYMGDLIVDFGTHLLPISMRQSIVIRNTNAFAVTVTVTGPVGDDSVFAMIDPNSFPLSAHNAESLTFDWFPKSAGRWKAVYTLWSGAEKIGTITVIGVSVAEFTLVADTVYTYAGKPWLPGESPAKLHVRIQTDPTPVNVDTIRFRVNFNGNVLQPDAALNCEGSSTLCGYTLSTQRAADWLDIALTRPAHGPVVALDLQNAVLTIPIRTFVSTTDSTPIWFSNVQSDAGYAGDTLRGMVYVLDTCGTPEMRRLLQGKSIVAILGITPNPATSDVSVSIASEVSAAATAIWIDAVGDRVSFANLRLEAGTHDYTLRTPAASGSYILELSLPGYAPDYRRVQVIR